MQIATNEDITTSKQMGETRREEEEEEGRGQKEKNGGKSTRTGKDEPTVTERTTSTHNKACMHMHENPICVQHANERFATCAAPLCIPPRATYETT